MEMWWCLCVEVFMSYSFIWDENVVVDITGR